MVAPHSPGLLGTRFAAAENCDEASLNNAISILHLTPDEAQWLVALIRGSR